MNSVQLELFGHGLIPWEGISPRELTRAFKSFSFATEVAGAVRGFVDVDQIEMFDTATTTARRPPYMGAPLLHSFPKERR